MFSKKHKNQYNISNISNNLNRYSTNNIVNR